jgi:hypothetical protein
VTSKHLAGLAGTQERLLDVCNISGELIGRVPFSKAEELIAAGLASPIGRKATKYLVLNCDEPTLEKPYRGGSRTTYRERVPTRSGLSSITQHKSTRL